MGNLRMNADQISYKGGEKPMSVEEAIKNAGNTGLAHTADIAPDFSTESAYSAGDYVYHNGTLYVFTSNHAAGAWSASDTQSVTVGGEIGEVKSGLIGQQFLFAENVQRVEVLEYNSINIGKISTFTLHVKSLISASNTPSIGDFSIMPKKDTAINCIDITDGVSASLGNSVSCAVSSIGIVFIKEMITNHIYLISGTFVTD